MFSCVMQTLFIDILLYMFVFVMFSVLNSDDKGVIKMILYSIIQSTAKIYCYIMCIRNSVMYTKIKVMFVHFQISI